MAIRADFVTQQKLTESPKDAAHCPHCGSDKVRLISHEHTLVGWFDGEDPNHNWQHHGCNACDKTFVREYKSGNVWYTDARGGRVLAGMPNCFERYVYGCRACGAPMTIEYQDLAGRPTKSLSSRQIDGRWVNDYVSMLRCAAGHGGLVDDQR